MDKKSRVKRNIQVVLSGTAHTVRDASWGIAIYASTNAECWGVHVVVYI
jgi:hypothetical protein